MQKIAVDGANIVLRGSFNPAIFQPAWFGARGLIPDQEAIDAKIEVIADEVTVFSLEWLNIQVLRDRFVAETVQASSFEVLRDLVAGTFSILEHTPVTMLGLNSLRHFEMRTESDWHEFGRRLAPPAPWEAVLEKPGLKRLSMIGPRDDDYRGSIEVTVEPSTKVTHGVYMSINDHYQISGDREAVPAESAVNIINHQWSSFLDRADRIANALFDGGQR